MELLCHNFCSAYDRLCFVVEESSATNIIRKHFWRCGSEVFGGGVLGEEAGSYFINALVGALRGEDCRDQKLPRAVVVEGAGGARVGELEAPEDFGDASGAVGCGFGLVRVSS